MSDAFTLHSDILDTNISNMGETFPWISNYGKYNLNFSLIIMKINDFIES